MTLQQEQANVPMGPGLCRHRLGVELRGLREAAALRLEDVAAALELATSTLSRIENGLAPARTGFVNTMLDMYRVSDQGCRQRLIDMAREAQRKSWLADFDDVLPAAALPYIGLESAASSVRSFAALTVPDLAQTADYARALHRAVYPLRSAHRIGKLAAVTMRRQELARGNSDQRLHLIAYESALLRRIGPPRVMAGQLDRLATMTADPSLTVQIVPLEQRCTVLAASFTVLSFDGPGAPDVACRGEVHDAADVIRRAREVAMLAATFGALSVSALPPEDSADLIRRLANLERNRL